MDERMDKFKNITVSFIQTAWKCTRWRKTSGNFSKNSSSAIGNLSSRLGNSSPRHNIFELETRFEMLKKQFRKAKG